MPLLCTTQVVILSGVEEPALSNVEGIPLFQISARLRQGVYTTNPEGSRKRLAKPHDTAREVGILHCG